MTPRTSTTGSSSSSPSSPSSPSSSSPPSPLFHAIVIVLGDVGRSPRMQYHALSLLEEGYNVSLVGYEGEEVIVPLQEYCRPDDKKKKKAHLQVVRFRPWSPPKWISKESLWGKVVYYPWRLLGILTGLVHALFWQTQTTPQQRVVVLVQNPPSIPLLWITCVYCWIQPKNRRWMMDWHNLGYSMLAPGLLRRVAQWYEGCMAPLAHGHFFVTRAMKEFVQQKFGSSFLFPLQNAGVLYDRPPDFFRPTSIVQQHELFLKLQEEWEAAPPVSLPHNNNNKKKKKNTTTTLFTEEVSPGTVILRPDRPALVVSSTSWTPDEDFSILFEALVLLQRFLEESSKSSKQARKIVVIVTGKGPLQAHYQEEIRKTFGKNDWIGIRTLWLESQDYPQLLGCADLGVCLHTSTSGLDLPMKVVDMLGCQVPVCAYGYPSLSELLQDGVQGRIFGNASELATQLHQLLVKGAQREQLQRQIRNMVQWRENWKQHGLPLLQHAATTTADPTGRLLLLLTTAAAAGVGGVLWALGMPKLQNE